MARAVRWCSIRTWSRSGFGQCPSNYVASDLERQSYNGKPVLTWWQGNVTGTGEINSGEDVVVNQHYQTVAKLRGKNGWILTLHAMQIRGHDAWVTANKNVPYNLSDYGGVNNGVLVESAIQEYDLRTGKLLYTWNASDHIPLSESKTQPPTNGFGYDAYHVNAVQVRDNGTMLVSMRNTSALYLIDITAERSCGRWGARTRASSCPSRRQFEWQHDAQMLNDNTSRCSTTTAATSPAPACTWRRPASRAVSCWG